MKTGRRKSGCVVSILLALCLSATIGYGVYHWLVGSPKYIYAEPAVGGYVYNLCNNYQYVGLRQKNWLGTYNGKLYVYRSGTDSLFHPEEDGWIKVIEGTDCRKVFKPGKGSESVLIISQRDNLVYYISASDVMCYDLDTGLERTTGTVPVDGVGLCEKPVWTADGDFRFPSEADQEKEGYLVVNGRPTAAESGIGYSVGGKTYCCFGEFGIEMERMIRARADDPSIPDSFIELGWSDECFMIPFRDGLLIHNAGGNDLLYYLGVDGELEELFRCDCMSSESAVTTHGDCAFLSVKRYEGYDEETHILLKRYENDTVEGTYRFDLAAGTTEKITDRIYESLYNLDDECLYGITGEGGVDRFAFDGALLQKVIEVRK